MIIINVVVVIMFEHVSDIALTAYGLHMTRSGGDETSWR